MSKSKPPDPTQTANTQQKYNIGAGTSQQELNMVGQNTPFGSLSYDQTGTNPDGTPKFTATQTATPQVQSAYDQLLGKINNQGDVTGEQFGLYSKYMQPLIDQQQRQLDTRLQNQGITTGSDAYNNAQNLQARNVGDQRTNWLLNSGNLAMQEQNQPFQQLSSLRTGAAPGFGSTPNTQIQPANYAGLAEQNYAQQLQQNNAMMSGLFGVPTALLGGWARGGFQSPNFG